MVCDCLRLVDICHLWLPHTLPIFWSYLLLYVLPSQVQRTENLCSQTALQLQHKSEAWFLPIECKTWIQKQAMGGGGQVWDTQYADHECGGGFSFFRAPSTQPWAALRLRSNGCDSEVFTKIVPIAWLAQLSGPPGVCESPNILWKLLFLTHTSHSGSCYL